MTAPVRRSSWLRASAVFASASVSRARARAISSASEVEPDERRAGGDEVARGDFDGGDAACHGRGDRHRSRRPTVADRRDVVVDPGLRDRRAENGRQRIARPVGTGGPGRRGRLDRGGRNAGALEDRRGLRKGSDPENRRHREQGERDERLLPNPHAGTPCSRTPRDAVGVSGLDVVPSPRGCVISTMRLRTRRSGGRTGRPGTFAEEDSPRICSRIAARRGGHEGFRHRTAPCSSNAVRSSIRRGNSRRRADRLPHSLLLQLVQPEPSGRVGRRAPVAAGRERAAGRDLRAVGHRRALELAELEEAPEEDSRATCGSWRGRMRACAASGKLDRPDAARRRRARRARRGRRPSTAAGRSAAMWKRKKSWSS